MVSGAGGTGSNERHSAVSGPLQETLYWKDRSESSRIAQASDAACARAFRTVCERDDPVDSLSQPVLIQGRAVDALELIPDESVQTVVTSPPYWSLRDYEVDRQIGRDDSLNDYVDGIVETFRKMRRLLTPTGAVWLNVGDSYIRKPHLSDA